MNSLVSSRKTPTSGLRKSFRIRSNACTNSSGVSARITPRLPESASGLSTQGKVISPAVMSWSGFECKGDLLKAGTFSPASRNRCRERYLSRQMSVAPGGCPRKPSLWQARAPVEVGRSPMETIASRGLDAAKSQIFCAEASGSSKRRGTAPSCHGSSSTWHRSVPKVMDSPNFFAASIKAHVWYPVVVHNTRSLFGWEVPIMAGPNHCTHFSSRPQTLARCTSPMRLSPAHPQWCEQPVCLGHRQGENVPLEKKRSRAHVLHMQKALDQMNLQIHRV